MEKRSQKYIGAKRTNPITKSADVKASPDKHIDQDFNGYPASPAKENIINPKTAQEKKIAAVNVQDGEKTKKYNKEEKEDEVDEQQSDGSAGAFSESDFLLDDEA